MTAHIEAPFFEIGPKNYLRRREIEALAQAAGRAGAECGVSVVLTVPTALVSPIRELDTGVLVFAQGVDTVPLGESMARVTAESLADARADGVMLNHDSSPLDPSELAAAVEHTRQVGLLSIVCAGTESDALNYAELGPAVVLFEPPTLIGTFGTGSRDWIKRSTDAIHHVRSGVLAMHAGGVATPAVAEAIMVAGADGTGSTSGILTAESPALSAQKFIAATRVGWDRARRTDRITIRPSAHSQGDTSWTAT
ncbi:MAG: triose-phosphate isomerase [Rhodococcus sp. (in: high G+C Gram-positive bacteria)]